MPNEIEIVISAKNRFAPVFDQLDSAFERTLAAGGQMQSAFSGIGGAMAGLTESTMRTEEALVDFSEQNGERLTAIAEQRQQFMEEQSLRQEEMTRELGERLLGIDEEENRRRLDVQERFQAQRVQSQARLHEQMINQRTAFEQRISDAERAAFSARINLASWFYDMIYDLAEGQGKNLARLTKSLGIARALVEAHVAANITLASTPFPFNLPLAALVLAQGLANVERIRQINIAHGGIDHIPEDSTFLLQRGERVLSPNQNRDLGEFLTNDRQRDSRGEVTIQNLNIHILENATSAEALLDMDANDLRQLVAERIIPSLDELARLGVRPNFVENNT